MEGLICEAIEGRRVVSFRYGRDSGSRLCHPHILYEGSTGKLLVGERPRLEAVRGG